MKRANVSTTKTNSAARAAAVISASVEIYTPERLAEFFLNNAMDQQDYLDARKEVQSMGIDPDKIPQNP